MVALLSGCGQIHFGGFQPLHEETRTTNVQSQEGAALSVTAVNGAIAVNQSDRDDVEIVTHLRAESQERLEGAKVVAFQEGESGTLSVSVEWPDGKRRGREGCSFEVLIPGANGVTLGTTNGRIDLAGLAGRAELRTSNGTIEVTGHDGPLDATTSNGTIKANGVRGDIDSSTSNGRIEIDDAVGRVDAKTSNGSISISFAADGTGPFVANTSNGSVTLELNSGMQGRLTLSTSNGSVKIDSGLEKKVVSEQKSRAVLDLGGSESQSRAATSNGSIHVRMSEGAASVEASSPAGQASRRSGGYRLFPGC